MKSQRRRRETNQPLYEHKAVFVEKKEIWWDIEHSILWNLNMFHILITCCFLFSSSECSLTQWEETEKVDKHESTTHQHCSWMENSFLNSFLEWIRDKIISLSPDQPRMAYEMSIPRNRFKNSIHIDVIVHKDFPLPSYAPGMQLSFFVRMCLNILYILIFYFFRTWRWQIATCVFHAIQFKTDMLVYNFHLHQKKYQIKTSVL